MLTKVHFDSKIALNIRARAFQMFYTVLLCWYDFFFTVRCEKVK